MKEIRLIRPNGLHEHLRDGNLLKMIIHFFNMYEWLIAEGNLTKPVYTDEGVKNYSAEIHSYPITFSVIMAVMLVKTMTAEILKKSFRAGASILKLIPEGVSTNSEECVSLENLWQYYPLLGELRDLLMYFSLHLELAKDSTGREIDKALRETAALIYGKDVVKAIPGLRISFEHASTIPLLEFIMSAPDNVFATLTAHHACFSKLDLYKGGVLQPHLLCNPILKSSEDCLAILRIINSHRNKKCGFGSDCAAHINKNPNNPASGCFAPPLIGIPKIIQSIEEAGMTPDVEALNNFFSFNGSRHYHLPPTMDTIVVRRKRWRVPLEYRGIVPICAGEDLEWQIEGYEFPKEEE